MDKRVNCALGLSIVAAILSIVAVCIAAYRTPELGFDYQGVLVSVLSLLVTILIGFQIYNSITINKKVDSIDSIVASTTKNEIDRYSHSVKSFVLTLSTLDLYHRNIAELAIDNFMHALDEGIKGTDKDAILLPLGYLQIIKEDNNGIGKILIGKKKKYIQILSQIDDERIDGLIDFVLRAKEIQRE